MSIRFALMVLALSSASPANAQWGNFIKDKLSEQARDKASRAANEASDAAYQGAKEKAKGAPGERKDQAEPSEDRGGKASAGGAERGSARGGSDEVPAGEVYGNKFDFIPGDRVLLFDDFAETDVGDYPARWTLKDGGGNAVEVVSYKGRKWFKSTASENGINDPSVHWLRYDPKPDLPKKFTIELDADMGGLFSVLFNAQQEAGGREIRFARDAVQTAQVRAAVKPYGAVVKRISISVNGTYAKVYVGGVRVLQDPDAIERPIRRIGLRFDLLLGRAEHQEETPMLHHQMITGFRLAEGGKDVAQALGTEGRIVVHGIYFATGSDVIQPESGGALRAVLALLQEDAALRFRIEGHTDDQGGPKVNGPLSDQRAAAVKAWLVSQGVQAGRLETKGLGATKPIGANDTQEGRANNRRVEFVKL